MGKRRSLEQHLRPIAQLELPGKEHLERYVLYKYRLNLKAGTIRGTVEYGKLFLSFLKGLGKKRPEEVSREELEAFVEAQQDRGLKPQTVHTRLTYIRTFLNYLRKEGVVDPEVLYRRIIIQWPVFEGLYLRC